MVDTEETIFSYQQSLVGNSQRGSRLKYQTASKYYKGSI